MKNRGSGVLLHITSLPSPYGIGDLGPWAYRFADILAKSRQKYWQVLPLNLTDQGCGNSPYSSPSAFAGNTLLISPELLLESGFLTTEDIAEIPPFPQQRCDFAAVVPYKATLFRRAYECFRENENEKTLFEEFCEKNKTWLEDFALFMAIKDHHRGKAWVDWDPGLRDRNPEDLEKARHDLHDPLEREKFLQYLFFKQWSSLKTYCNNQGIKLIGDIPIYVNGDSADVWTHPDLFKLNEEKRPSSVAGVPPDYFCQAGQLWGNPIFRWDVLRQTGYAWWLERLSHHLRLLDFLRIDHFRGFVAYWEVPASETTAVKGQWVEAPANDFFTALLKKIPADFLIAEDLGLITQDVTEIMSRFGFPGMRVLQFAFDGDLATHPFLPHNYIPNCIAYTGTHDNNTLKGWFENEITPEDRQKLFRYLGREVSCNDLPKELIRLLMMSIAQTVIIPVQDILGLGEEARLNRPSSAKGNWEWRLLPDQLSSPHQEMLRELTSIYKRAL
jgi:4-alpha-glucanotransferase